MHTQSEMSSSFVPSSTAHPPSTDASEALGTSTRETATYTTTASEAPASNSPASQTSYLRSSSLVVPASSTPSASATTRTSATSATTSQKSHPSSGISNGALAGAIVGSVVGTATLTLLAAFLYFRSIRKRHLAAAPGDPSSNSPDMSSPQEQIAVKAYGPVASSQKERPPLASATRGSQFFDLSAYVPIPADDNTVCTRIQTLFDQASLHVDNYYAQSPAIARLAPDAVNRINHFGSPYLAAPPAAMLSRRAVQRALITHVLVWALLQDIQPGSQAGSLLPQLYRSMPQQHGNTAFDFDEDRSIFAWRMLTAYIYNQRLSTKEQAVAARDDAIASLAERFTKVFEPYNDPNFTESHRLGHLTSVLKAAADLGVWLFAQPCSFNFSWSTPAATMDQVTVLPAVVKVCDEHGQRLLVPQVLVEEVSMQL